MQLQAADGTTTVENGMISSDRGVKQSDTATNVDPVTEAGDAVRSMINEDGVGASESQVQRKENVDAERDEEKGDGEGGAEDATGIFPAARVKRIMRKNPDKKKNFAKDTVHVVALATVSATRMFLVGARCDSETLCDAGVVLARHDEAVLPVHG